MEEIRKTLKHKRISDDFPSAMIALIQIKEDIFWRLRVTGYNVSDFDYPKDRFENIDDFFDYASEMYNALHKEQI